MTSPPNSILTKTLRRRLLTGEKPSNPHRDRKAIRDRVIAGVLDLNLLSQYWPQKEMDKVFPPLYVDNIFEYYYDSETYSDEDLIDFLGEDYTEEDRRIRLGPEYTQLKSSSRAYLSGLNTFLLRMLRAGQTASKVQTSRDLIAPELQDFESLIEDAVTQHLAQSHRYKCEVQVSIDVSECLKFPEDN